MFNFLVAQSASLVALGCLVLRIGIGIIFIIHGYGKFAGGMGTLTWVGSQMSNLGISFFPLLWGFLAASAEFFGGVFLVVGLGTRVAAFFLSIVMLIAILYHIKNGDTYTTYSHPLSMLIVFISLMLMGSGRFALDSLLF